MDGTQNGTDSGGPRLGGLDLADAGVLAACVEAILLTTDKPIGAGKIAQALTLEGEGTKARVEGAIEALNSQYEETGRCFRIRMIAGGYRVVTEPAFAPALLSMHGMRQSSKLSKPALEALSIIAYRQPVTRSQIEAIRGVSCGEVLKSLLERRLIDITGRAEELGRPMLYGTSKHFLEVFGLGSVKDLPEVGDIPDLPRANARAAASEEAEPAAELGEVELKGAVRDEVGTDSEQSDETEGDAVSSAAGAGEKES